MLLKLCAPDGTLVADVGAGVEAGGGAGAGAPPPLFVEAPGAPEVEPLPTEGSVVPLDGGKRAELDVLKGLAEPEPQPTIVAAAKETAAKLSSILERECTHKPPKTRNRFIQTRFASTLAT